MFLSGMVSASLARLPRVCSGGSVLTLEALMPQAVRCLPRLVSVSTSACTSMPPDKCT